MKTGESEAAATAASEKIIAPQMLADRVTCNENAVRKCVGTSGRWELVEINADDVKINGRLALLNAFVPLDGGFMYLQRIDYGVAERIVDRAIARGVKIESYIRHEDTAEFLSTKFKTKVPVNKSKYTPSIGDVAIVARLRGRSTTQTVNEDTLELWLVHYL